MKYSKSRTNSRMSMRSLLIVVGVACIVIIIGSIAFRNVGVGNFLSSVFSGFINTEPDGTFVEARNRPQNTTKTAALRKGTVELREKIQAASSLGSISPTTPLEMLQAAQSRKKALLDLMDENPAEAATMLITPEERALLPQSTAAYVEQPVTETGYLEAVIGESFPDNAPPIHKKFYSIIVNGSRHALHFADKEPTFQGGTKIQITGKKIDDDILIEKSETDFKVLSPGSQPFMQAGAVALAAATTTTFKTAVILFNFSDDKSQPFTPNFWRDAVFTSSTSINAFYGELSFGKMRTGGVLNPVGDVFGWVTIPAKRSQGCNQFGWADQAEIAAQAVGYVPANYDQVIFVHPRFIQTGTLCIYDGNGELGANALPGHPVRLWMNGYYTSEVLLHEAGHNLNMHHANLRICTNSAGGRVPYSNTCEDQEYGDSHDIMGYRILRHFNGLMKQKTNFFTTKNVKTITASGLYTLYPIEKMSSSTQAYRISVNTDEYLYIDFRTIYGFDRYAPTDTALTGVMLRMALKGDTATYLIDTTPKSKAYITGYYKYTPDFADGALGIGKTFTYNFGAGPISIKTISATPEKAVIQVTMP